MSLSGYILFYYLKGMLLSSNERNERNERNEIKLVEVHSLSRNILGSNCNLSQLYHLI